MKLSEDKRECLGIRNKKQATGGNTVPKRYAIGEKFKNREKHRCT